MTRNGAEYARRVGRAPRGHRRRGAGRSGSSPSTSCGCRCGWSACGPGGTAEPWALAVGTARGAIDFIRGRWGPPPSNLPGMGDVGNV